MITALSIRDVVLIQRLDLAFGPGLTALTGETGAGKSILLDSLGLALGDRGDPGLVRTGADQASVTAEFAPPRDHPAFAVLAELGVAAEDAIILRRVIGRDGRSRAFINDQPVAAAALRRAGGSLVEIQGQHDQMGLADPAQQGPLLDAFGVTPEVRADVVRTHRRWSDALAARDAAREAIAAARRDEDWLRHAVADLTALAPAEGEEEALAAERLRLQQDERRAEAIAAAHAELAPGAAGGGLGRDRRNAGPAGAVRAAARALERLTSPGRTQGGSDRAADASGADDLAAPLAALARAEEALAEAEALIARLLAARDADPHGLERAEERLFALRAAARRHAVAVAELPSLLVTLRDRLAALDTGSAHAEALDTEARAAGEAFVSACAALTEARREAAIRLDAAVAQELAPLRLARARFHTELAQLPKAAWGAAGADSVRFLLAANAGQAPAPLARAASGGELSRLMLALKVVLARGAQVATLVFDEVDAGIGGATAAAVGDRLARLARSVQVLVVTHSPQVAARGAAHLLVAKLEVGSATGAGRMETRVTPLDGAARREEIARMLAGETVTDAARAAADDLLAGAQTAPPPPDRPAGRPADRPGPRRAEPAARGERRHRRPDSPTAA